MKQLDRRAAENSMAALRRRGCLAGALLLTCCGGNVAAGQASIIGGAAGTSLNASGGNDFGSSGGNHSSSGATGGSSGLATGGDTNDGGQSSQVGEGGMLASVGGADTAAGAADEPDTTCDSSQLLKAILHGALGGLGTCEFAAPPAASEKLGPRRGAVVLDSTGRVIDNTGLPAAIKQAWLDQLMDQRWLCLAGQTLGYKCSAAG